MAQIETIYAFLNTKKMCANDYSKPGSHVSYLWTIFRFPGLTNDAQSSSMVRDMWTKASLY
jgi:hypothetical protein